ncbi:MAG: Superoxide dismutase, Fe-Mn family [Candidatus Adlerbacteria bacterium GW2011_GWC1_50_9]|uniref:superoxide dismutase n=1 Tax=Candidatus Adlerbacteria bacterium GW2011_GWC1_50_9 TaxID=1618608 RepID=A0A0G1WSE8_9BACT|nr:MAG: Superoxide dismutase, Fe-Mn family [Candidatus Adlerbacteria bacterium GW2011_GWC1_50_9]
MYEPKNYDHLIGTPGFSEVLLKNHFTLYQGYVKNTNALIEAFADLEKNEKAATPAYAELKRRFPWEFNGMRLHEFYFGNMTSTGGALDSASGLYKKIVEGYGSFETWEKNFKAVGAMRGIGWAILYEDSATGDLFNIWVNEHDFGHLTGAKPILVLDVFEHAYILDYGLKRADYIEAFFKAIDWGIVLGRFGK